MKFLSMLFTCTNDARFEHLVLCNIPGLEIKSGMNFLDIFDTENLDKAQRFFLGTYSPVVTEDTELVINASGKPLVLSFKGIRTGDCRLIMAESEFDEILGYYHDLMSLNNQLVNTIRSLYKDSHRQQTESIEINYLEELSKVNNDLITIQRELNKKNAELERLNELKNRFVGMAAHDLRSPLGVIKGFSNFLLDDLPEDADATHREFITIINSTSSYMLKLVEDTLDLTYMESGKIKLELIPTDFCELFRESIRLQQALASKKDILLIPDACPENCTLMIDPTKIRQVLSNLIGNAIKYSPCGTEVHLGAKIVNNELHISITDHGYGISKDEQGLIFEPFRKAASSANTKEQSAGLGLAITKNIVLAHKGKIWVQSEAGKGSTFAFSLPLNCG